MSAIDDRPEPHPLDGCDEDECYKVMMAERNVLITARRETEDNLIKTIIQLSSALIALMAGFASQSQSALTVASLVAFSLSVSAFGLAILFGLGEQYFSSKAYLEQQSTLERYYRKEVQDFSEAKYNKFVRITQISAFISFVMALLALALFGFQQARELTNVGQDATAASSTTASSTTASSSSAAASNP